MNFGVVDSSGGSLPLDPEALASAARARWPGQVSQVLMNPHEGNLCTLVITPGGAPEYQIFLLGPEVQVRTDGTDEQAFEVAVWVGEQLPQEWTASEAWFVDEAFTGHAALAIGMSPADLRLAWVEHDD